MIIRKAAFATYAALLASSSTARRALDRRGQSLSSGGDNDLVLTLLAQGWAAAYAPDLRLTHHIPAGRTQPRYLGRLRRGIFRCWTTVCALHALSAPPKLPPWRSRLMIMREWIRHRAWRGGRSWVEWMGVAGKLEGQTDLYHLEAAIVAPASSR